MDIQLFDNYEDDGQLSMFDMGEDIETLTVSKEEKTNVEVREQAGTVNIRIQKCSTCGKILYVREEKESYVSFCNACGISYLQKM